jgi:hypothetical protein
VRLAYRPLRASWRHRVAVLGQRVDGRCGAGLGARRSCALGIGVSVVVLAPSGLRHRRAGSFGIQALSCSRGVAALGLSAPLASRGSPALLGGESACMLGVLAACAYWCGLSECDAGPGSQALGSLLVLSAALLGLRRYGHRWAACLGALDCRTALCSWGPSLGRVRSSGSSVWAAHRSVFCELGLRWCRIPCAASLLVLLPRVSLPLGQSVVWSLAALLAPQCGRLLGAGPSSECWVLSAFESCAW